MYVITAHQRHRQTDGQTDVKRSHDRYIAKACSGKNSVDHRRLEIALLLTTAQSLSVAPQITSLDYFCDLS